MDLRTALPCRIAVGCAPRGRSGVAISVKDFAANRLLPRLLTAIFCALRWHHRPVGADLQQLASDRQIAS